MVGQTISHYKILEKPPTTSQRNRTSAKELADKPSGQAPKEPGQAPKEPGQVGEGGIL